MKKIKFIFILCVFVSSPIFSVNIEMFDVKKITTDKIISSIVYSNDKLYYFNNDGLCEYDLQSNTKNTLFTYNNFKTSKSYYNNCKIGLNEAGNIGKIALSNDGLNICFNANFSYTYQYGGETNEENRPGAITYNIGNNEIDNKMFGGNIDGWAFNDHKIVWNTEKNDYSNGIIGYTYYDTVFTDSRTIIEDYDPEVSPALQTNGNVLAYSSKGVLCTLDVDYGVSDITGISAKNYLLWSPDNKCLFRFDSEGMQNCDFKNNKSTQILSFKDGILKKH